MTDQQEQNTSTAGEILRSEREGQGLSIEEVHDVTKIPMDAIRAIEEGYTIRTLSPFYRKSFIKIYAKFLNLDATEVLRDEVSEPAPKRAQEDTEKMIVFSVRPFLSKIFTPIRIRQISIILGLLLVFFLLFKGLSFIIAKVSSAIKNRPAKKEVVIDKAPPVVQETKEVVKQEVKVTPPPAPQQVIPPTPVPVPPPAVVQKDVNITVRSTGKAWLRVRSDGETIFQSTLQKGDVETWEADKNIEISGGIHRLEFEINGQLIGKLGRRDRRAKSVIITKDGMEVQKDD